MKTTRNTGDGSVAEEKGSLEEEKGTNAECHPGEENPTAAIETDNTPVGEVVDTGAEAETCAEAETGAERKLRQKWKLAQKRNVK